MSDDRTILVQTAILTWADTTGRFTESDVGNMLEAVSLAELSDVRRDEIAQALSALMHARLLARNGAYAITPRGRALLEQAAKAARQAVREPPVREPLVTRSVLNFLAETVRGLTSGISTFRAIFPTPEPAIDVAVVPYFKLAISTTRGAVSVQGEQAQDCKPEDDPRRFADCTLFTINENDGSLTKLAAGIPLRKGSWYELEVAIRQKPQGVPFSGERKEFREPHMRTDIKLLVAFIGNAIEIEQPLASLTLPPSGDSANNARVRIQPTQASAGGREPSVRIKIFYELNLLESLTLRTAVVAADAEMPASVAAGSVTLLSHDDVQLDYDDLAYVAPKRLNIGISLRDDGYQLTFVFSRDGRDDIAFVAHTYLGTGQLESMLLEIRKTLFSIVASPSFGTTVDGMPATMQDQLDNLAASGRRLWTLLFRREEGALWEIGAMLAQYPLPLGAYVQIHQERGTERFVVPWGLLYDGALSLDQEIHASADRFWGFRYVVEQRLPQVRADAAKPVLVAPPDPKLGIMLWPFTGSEAHVVDLKTIVEEAGGSVDSVIERRSLALAHFGDCDSDILYILSHGHTQFPNSNRFGFSESDFLSLYDRLPHDSPLRSEWATIRDDISKHLYDSDRSWIGLRYGKVFLDELYAEDVRLVKRPIVILNMCESAQITPTLDVSFIHFFLSRHSRTVIGTECAMRPVFSQAFCTILMRRIMADVPVGEALLETRRAFLTRNNPLGLAFSLYGAATAAFERTLALLPPQPSERYDLVPPSR
jgi:hypothetical protein